MFTITNDRDIVSMGPVGANFSDKFCSLHFHERKKRVSEIVMEQGINESKDPCFQNPNKGSV